MSISVIGNPNGAAPPGASNFLLDDPSNITYSSNTDYWVNVSIPHVYKDGDIMSPDWIPAWNVEVLSTHPSVTGSTSEISTWTPFPGSNMEMNVWGSGPMVPLLPVFTGTQTAGPSSDYIYFWYGVPDYTSVSWRVTIPVGIPEGQYRAFITYKIEG